MTLVSLFIAVLSIMSIVWLGRKHKERLVQLILLNRWSNKDAGIRVPISPDFGSSMIVVLATVYFALAVALVLTL